MVQLVNFHNTGSHVALIDAMHADRKRVFVDMLKWDVPHDGIFERDEYDDEFAEYLIVQDEGTGDHLGSLRLLRTDRPHLLGDHFAHLCERPVPASPQIREITRLCLSPRHGAAARIQARNLLARSLVEFGLLTGIRAYTGVADMAWLTQILSAGWRCMPLGLPQYVGGSKIGALQIDISPETLRLLAQNWRCPATTMRVVEFDFPLAA